MVKPSHRREMAHVATKHHGISVSLACKIFCISEVCFRYERRLVDENQEVADWLVRLTAAYRNWGFGMCFLYLRNVKKFS